MKNVHFILQLLILQTFSHDEKHDFLTLHVDYVKISILPFKVKNVILIILL
jgi:hypothetical protein